MQITGFSLKSIAVIANSALFWTALSVFAYEYYISTSDKIISIAKDEIRSNSRIASYDLSYSLKNKLDNISGNLAILSASASVQNGETERVKVLLIAAQNSSSDLADFYNWADKDGEIKVSGESTEKIQSNLSSLIERSCLDRGFRIQNQTCSHTLLLLLSLLMAGRDCLFLIL